MDLKNAVKNEGAERKGSLNFKKCDAIAQIEFICSNISN